VLYVPYRGQISPTAISPAALTALALFASRHPPVWFQISPYCFPPQPCYFGPMQAEAALAAPTLIYKLTSIVKRLEPAELFPKAQPLEVELGSGDGSFLVNYAKIHPERNFLGVERLLGRLRKLSRKGLRAGLTNLRGLRIESAYLVEYLLPPASVSALHIYFPDPWPKRKHRKNRLVNDRFTEIVHQALAPDGVIYLRTDDADYFAQMQAVFAANASFRAVETPEELRAVITDFERNFHARGVATLRAAYVKG
jgi:tRNA (guanine-N7-)-methyltransferase